jgi:hypothetical protein
VADQRPLIFGRLRLGLGIGLMVFIGLITSAPAQWWSPLLPRILGPSWICHQWSGSLWAGRCEQLAYSSGPLNVDLGRLGWQIVRDPGDWLPTGVRLGWRRAEGWAQATVWLFREREIAMSEMRVNAPIETLIEILPPAWSQSLGGVRTARGRLRVDIAELGWSRESFENIENLLCAEGTLQLTGLQLANWPSPLGVIEMRPVSPCERGMELRDLGGPLQITLRLQAPTRQTPARAQWQLLGTVTPRPDSIDQWASILRLLGPMQANGGYPVDLSLEWRPAR